MSCHVMSRPYEQDQLRFFLLQWVIVTLQSMVQKLAPAPLRHRFARLPLWFCIPLTHVVLLLTAPLFFTVYHRIHFVSHLHALMPF